MRRGARGLAASSGPLASASSASEPGGRRTARLPALAVGVLVAALGLAASGAAAEKPMTHGSHATNTEPRAAPLALPDTVLLDEHGRRVRFASDVLGDRVVAIQFVFTSCTTICPPLGAAFGKLRTLLGARAGDDVELVSISVDPGNDTPERLLEWARRFGYGEGWTLLTGERQSVAAVLKSLGMATADAAAHSPVVWIGHRGSGRWTRTHGLAPAATLLASIDDVALAVDADRARRGERMYREGVGPDKTPLLASLTSSSAAADAAELPIALVACANCHGADRRGRTEAGVTVPDIRWTVLADPDGRRLAGGVQVPPYDPGTLRRAVTDGIDAAGRRLSTAMPRYRLNASQLADLVAYLRRAE
jgi:protein SCO1